MFESRKIPPTVRFILVAVAALGGCDNAESQIERKAVWLCRYGQLMGPNVTALPDSEDPGDYLHPDDLAYLDSDMAELGNAEVFAFMRLKQAIEEPWARAFVAIRALHTTCHVENILLTGDVAEAVVRRSVPDVETPEMLVEVRAELNAIPLQKHRMAFAQGLFAGQTDRVESEHEVTFRLTDSGWRAAFDLRERIGMLLGGQRDAEIVGEAPTNSTPPDPPGDDSELALGSPDSAEEPVRQESTQGAAPPVAEIDSAVPENRTVAPGVVPPHSVAAGWFRRPDSDNTTIALVGTGASGGFHEGEAPELQVRCPDGDLELSVAMGVRGHATKANQTELAVSLNGRKPKKVRATAVGPRGGFLLPRAGVWVKRLTRKKSHTLTVVAPLADSAITAEFILDGAAKAVRPVLKACRKKRSKRRSN